MTSEQRSWWNDLQLDIDLAKRGLRLFSPGQVYRPRAAQGCVNLSQRGTCFPQIPFLARVRLYSWAEAELV